MTNLPRLFPTIVYSFFCAISVKGQVSSSSASTNSLSRSSSSFSSSSSSLPSGTPVCLQPRLTAEYSAQRVSAVLLPAASAACDASLAKVISSGNSRVTYYQIGKVYFNRTDSQSGETTSPQNCTSIFTNILNACIPPPFSGWGGWLVTAGTNFSVAVSPDKPLPTDILPQSSQSSSHPSSTNSKTSSSLSQSSSAPSSKASATFSGSSSSQTFNGPATSSSESRFTASNNTLGSMSSSQTVSTNARPSSTFPSSLSFSSSRHSVLTGLSTTSGSLSSDHPVSNRSTTSVVAPSSSSQSKLSSVSLSSSSIQAAAPSTYVVVDVTFTGNPTSLVTGSITITPGALPSTIGGHTFKIPISASDSAVDVDGQITRLPAPNLASTTTNSVASSYTAATALISLPAGATVVTSISGSVTLSETFAPATNSRYASLTGTTTVVTTDAQSSVSTVIYGPGGIAWTPFNHPTGAPSLDPPNAPPSVSQASITTASPSSGPSLSRQPSSIIVSSLQTSIVTTASAGPVISGIGSITKTTLTGSGFDPIIYNVGTLSDLADVTGPTTITRAYTETDEGGHHTVVIGPIPVGAGGIILIHPPKGSLPDLSGLGGPIRLPKPGSLCNALLKFLCGPSKSQTGPPGSSSNDKPVDPDTEPEGEDPEQEEDDNPSASQNQPSESQAEESASSTAKSSATTSESSFSAGSSSFTTLSTSSSSMSSVSCQASAATIPPDFPFGFGPDGLTPLGDSPSSSASTLGSSISSSSISSSSLSSSSSTSNGSCVATATTVPPDFPFGFGPDGLTPLGSQMTSNSSVASSTSPSASSSSSVNGSCAVTGTAIPADFPFGFGPDGLTPLGGMASNSSMPSTSRSTSSLSSTSVNSSCNAAATTIPPDFPFGFGPDGLTALGSMSGSNASTTSSSGPQRSTISQSVSSTASLNSSSSSTASLKPSSSSTIQPKSSSKISSTWTPLITCDPTSKDDFVPATWCTACDKGGTTLAYGTISQKTVSEACEFKTLPDTISPSSTTPAPSCRVTSSANYSPATWCTGCNQGDSNKAYATINDKTGDAACAFSTLPSSSIAPSQTLTPPPTTPLPASCQPEPTGHVQDSHEGAVVDSAQAFCDDHVQGKTQPSNGWQDIDETYHEDGTIFDDEADDVYEMYLHAVPNCAPPGGEYTMDDPIPGYDWEDEYDDFYDLDGFGKVKRRELGGGGNETAVALSRLRKRVLGPYACFDSIYYSWRQCNNQGRGGEIQSGCIVFGIRTKY